MKILEIPYQQTNYFSKIINDYLKNDSKIELFYQYYPTISNFKKQLELKKSFSDKNRKNLVSVLQKQYKNSVLSNKTKQNILALNNPHTFTVTTGHQLNLFTGPLYFLYKIISVINLSEQLKNTYSDYNFVPIYWMATEDHDFEEINYFNFKNKKIQWNKKTSGAVGRIHTNGLEQVYNRFKKELGAGENAKKIADLFKKSYLNHSNLTEATHYLANELFKEYGLVIIDADDKLLKKEFSLYIKDELLNQTAFKEINKTKSKLGKNYKIQVNPREINLFYLKDNLRERILFEKNKYAVLNTNISFTEKEILDEVENFPERFSPNVIMRPLYQEVILPNLAYIGGGGELAYWLELKSYFTKVNVTFPMLILRNSALLITNKQFKKLEKLQISVDELFLKQQELINKKVIEFSNLNLDFSKQKEFLKQQFIQLKQIAEQTDKSFIGAVSAQEKKQINGLDNLEKRLLKAEKRKLKALVSRITDLQNQLFPNDSLQERFANFSEFFLETGEELIPLIKNNLEPLKFKFTVIKLP